MLWGHRTGGAAVAVVVGLWLALSATPASATGYVPPFCTVSGISPPCIQSATLNGAPVSSSTTANMFLIAASTINGSPEFMFDVESSGGSFDLGTSSLGDVWKFTLDTGTIVPRLVVLQGTGLTVTRDESNPSHNLLKVTVSPVTYTNNAECTWIGFPSCPYQASSAGQIIQLQVDSSQYSGLTTAQSDSFDGMNVSTNIAEFSTPPQVVPGSRPNDYTMIFQLANQHLLPAGSPYYGAVFHGNLSIRIPKVFMQQYYGVSAPSSVTPGGLSVAISSGTASVSEAPGGQALLVDLSGITFSHRKLRIRRGVITPRAPRHLRAHRTGRFKAKLKFRRAKARGARITGYRAFCKGPTKVRAHSRHSPIRLHGLHHGRYRCFVRAKSTAGRGKAAKTKLFVKARARG